MQRLEYFKHWAFSIFLAAIFLDPSLAQAEHSQNQLGMYLAQHGYGVFKVDTDDGNRQIIKAKINGKAVSLLIDTGCVRTCLKVGCARHLNLDVHETSTQLYGVGGTIKGQSGIALINSFTLSDYAINRTNTIAVLPKSTDLQEADGILGFDFLSLNAGLLLVGADYILLKPGDRPAPLLDQYMEQANFKAIPLHYQKGSLRVDGNLNGQALKALVDCGAEYSNFDLDYVKKTGNVHLSPLAMHFTGLDGNRMEAYGFIPKQIAFGPLVLDPIPMVACRAPLFANDGYNALLGYDLMGTHQAIIDLGHSILWMK